MFKASREVVPTWLQITKVSSTCRNHSLGLGTAVCIARVSRSSMKSFAKTGESGDTIGAPLICLYRWSSVCSTGTLVKVKLTSISPG